MNPRARTQELWRKLQLADTQGLVLEGDLDALGALRGDLEALDGDATASLFVTLNESSLVALAGPIVASAAADHLTWGSWART